MNTVLPTNFTCSNVSVFLFSKFELAYQEKLIISQLDNNTYTLHLAPLYFIIPPTKRTAGIISYGICQLLSCNIEGK